MDMMKASGQLAAKTLDLVKAHIRAGVSTAELDEVCHQFIIDNGAIPAPLNYKGFPKSICTSINEVVCHGIPNRKTKLREGDIINIDVTTILEGFHGDTSRMFQVGEVSPLAKKICDSAHTCMMRGIEAVGEGKRLGDIGYAIQTQAAADGFSVVREFVGHGIGRGFHEEPQVLHYGEAGRGVRLTTGMTFTIEPMINQGDWRTRMLKDGWTAVTKDGGLSAQWEHTLGIRKDGSVDILTLSSEG